MVHPSTIFCIDGPGSMLTQPQLLMYFYKFASPGQSPQFLHLTDHQLTYKIYFAGQPRGKSFAPKMLQGNGFTPKMLVWVRLYNYILECITFEQLLNTSWIKEVSCQHHWLYGQHAGISGWTFGRVNCIFLVCIYAFLLHIFQLRYFQLSANLTLYVLYTCLYSSLIWFLLGQFRVVAWLWYRSVKHCLDPSKVAIFA